MNWNHQLVKKTLAFGGYMMPMVGSGIPSRPATFAGMALDDL